MLLYDIFRDYSKHFGSVDNTVHSRMLLPRKVFTEPFPSSGLLFFLIKNLLPSNGRRSVVCFSAVA
jgi:hypothetical protein